LNHALPPVAAPGRHRLETDAYARKVRCADCAIAMHFLSAIRRNHIADTAIFCNQTPLAQKYAHDTVYKAAHMR
jgi:hypothetical protein